MSRKTKKPPAARHGQASPLFLALAILVVVVFAVFSPSLHSEFVYDSSGEIMLWDYLHHPANLLTAVSFKLMSMDVLDFNRPVAVASLMTDSIFWGYNPWGYHLTNILLHATVTCLGFLFIRHVLAQTGVVRDPFWRDWTVFWAMLLFVVHPIVTEAVCEPSNRKDLLAALFGLTALLLAARHRPEIQSGRLARMVLIPFLCLLAVGSKEVGAAYPAILLLYWLLFRRGEPGKFWVGVVAASATVVAVFLTARFVLEHRPSAVFLHPPGYLGGSFTEALVIQPRILALYVFNLLWPTQLSADYTPYSVRYLPLWLSLFLLALVLGLLGWWSAKDRRVLFAVGFVGATLLPVCNLVPIYHPAADRYLYNPLLGSVLIVAVALDASWLAAKSFRRISAAPIILILAALLFPLTRQREQVWSSDLALWQDTFKRNPDSLPALSNLPESLLHADRIPEAKAASEAALKTQYVTWPWIWFDYAIELNRLGDHSGAERAARRALDLKPDIGDAAKMMLTLQAQGDLVREFNQITPARPGSTGHDPGLPAESSH